MASRYLIIILYLFIYFKTITAHSNSSFSFNNFGQSSRFDSVLSLHGNAKVVNNGSSVQLTAPLNSSSGRVIYKNAIRFYSGKPKKLVSFSTYFSFSISSDIKNGDGLAFVVFSDGVNFKRFGLSNGVDFKFLSVEFDAFWNHVGINLSNFVSLKVMNLSSVDLGVSSGSILQVWIDYESMSRRLEVRVTKFGEKRPVDPLMFERIDLPKIWPENERFFVGLSSLNRNSNSSQLCNVYSWSFKTRRSPDWMHSEPLDPIAIKQGEGIEVKVHKKSDCVLRILSALILGIGLGALGSFIGMFLWTLFAKRQPIAPEEYATKAVVHDKASANEKQ